jgi:hypothetical protein
VCDFLGERLADFFGITTPKYQLEIDERLSMLQEEKEEQLKIEEDVEHWSGKLPDGPDVIPLEAGDLPRVFPDKIQVISEQPTADGDGSNHESCL